MSNVVDEHKKICNEIVELYAKKNADYGDSFGKARKEIPNYTIGKLYDKFNRLKNLMLGAERKVDDESIEDTLLDLANYSIMELAERRAEANESDSEIRWCAVSSEDAVDYNEWRDGEEFWFLGEDLHWYEDGSKDEDDCIAAIMYDKDTDMYFFTIDTDTNNYFTEDKIKYIKSIKEALANFVLMSCGNDDAHVLSEKDMFGDAYLFSAKNLPTLYDKFSMVANAYIDYLRIELE